MSNNSILDFFGFSKMPFGKDLAQKDIFETKSFPTQRPWTFPSENPARRLGPCSDSAFTKKT